VTSRGLRIAVLAGIAEASEHLERRIRSGGPMRLDLALAARLDELLAAAADVRALTRDEVVRIESARDVDGVEG
jgi:hypothetical protein